LPSESVNFSDAVDRIERIFKGLQPASNILVLIGGCSRSGKSTLAERLNSSLISKGTSSIVVAADYWLLPASERKAGATVLERYRANDLSNSVMALLKGESASVAAYDSRTRELSGELLTFKPQHSPFIIVVEGVLALALHKLRKISNLKLFVECGDCVRLKRLISFYRDLKMLRKSEYKVIIKEREVEEVPFIKATRAFADMVVKPCENLELSKEYDNILQRAKQ